MKRFRTAESVCIGHPDKVCDRISDAILDAALAVDGKSRVAVETLATSGKIFVAGEISCRRKLDVRQIVRDTLQDCGYGPNHYEIGVFLHAQSPDISEGVTHSLESRTYRMTEEIGAGDQGTMYGYATSETREMLPLPLVLAHRICWHLDRARLEGTIRGTHSDGKAQVSVEYEDEKPLRVSSVVISVQHDEDKDLNELEDEILKTVIPDAFSDFPIDGETKVYINPSGRFVEGGPEADTGLTGRKIMVDTYGGLAPHGGGAFSGKDCSKVDRSAAYMARFIAKHIVYAGVAKRCTVAISYAIGKANPVAVDIDTHGTGIFPEETISKAVQSVFPLKPGDIIDFLDLREPGFQNTATYGHFMDTCFTWEEINPTLAAELQEALENG